MGIGLRWLGRPAFKVIQIARGSFAWRAVPRVGRRTDKVCGAQAAGCPGIIAGFLKPG